MKIEIDYNGSVAICQVNNKLFNYCDASNQLYCLSAFKCIEDAWHRDSKSRKGEQNDMSDVLEQIRNLRKPNTTKGIKAKRANKIQQFLCDTIQYQQEFWRNSNDITSPAHLCEIEEVCNAQFCNPINHKDIEELVVRLKDLYWFVRRFDVII